MIIAKKIAAVLLVLVLGLIGFGYLPKDVADRITRAIAIVLVVGFAVRVGAYFLQ